VLNSKGTGKLPKAFVTKAVDAAYVVLSPAVLVPTVGITWKVASPEAIRSFKNFIAIIWFYIYFFN
jgi:hypothetical protein